MQKYNYFFDKQENVSFFAFLSLPVQAGGGANRKADLSAQYQRVVVAPVVSGRKVEAYGIVIFFDTVEIGRAHV